MLFSGRREPPARGKTIPSDKAHKEQSSYE